MTKKRGVARCRREACMADDPDDFEESMSDVLKAVSRLLIRYRRLCPSARRACRAKLGGDRKLVDDLLKGAKLALVSNSEDDSEEA